MSEQLRPTAGGKPLQVCLCGSGLINSPHLNQGTALDLAKVNLFR